MFDAQAHVRKLTFEKDILKSGDVISRGSSREVHPHFFKTVEINSKIPKC
jgi:hypothetical protein